MQAGTTRAGATAVFRRRCAAPAWGGWLKNPAKSGGGVFDLLIHDVDMMLHLFGTPESIVRDRLRGRCARHRHHPRAVFYYPTAESCWSPAAGIIPKSYPFSMEYTVTTDGGTLEFNSAGREPTLYREDGTEAETGVPRTRRVRGGDSVFRRLLQIGTSAGNLPAARIRRRRETRAL